MLTRDDFKRIEPYAYGFFNCESESRTMKIASAIHAFCEYGPLTIFPETKLATVDRCDRAFSSIHGPTARGFLIDCGSGLCVNPAVFERRKQEYPELADLFEEYKQKSAGLDSRTTFALSYSEQEKIIVDETNTLWGGRWGGHGNPDYKMLLELGTDGLREKIAKCRVNHPESDDLYDASLLVLDGIDILAERYRKYAIELACQQVLNAKMYLRIAKAFETIPKKPATDFMTACQLFALVFFLDGRDSPGTIDGFLSKYFLMHEDREEALEILEGLWMEFQRTRTYNVCIGGTDENWVDQSTELSHAILDLVIKHKFKAPNLTMRCSRNTPEELLRHAVKAIGAGTGMPVLYNDEVVCPALEALGIPPKDSHLYAMNGCNQIEIQGKSRMGLEDGEVCILKLLEYTLHRGKCLLTGNIAGIDTGDPTKFETFDELYAAFKKHIDWGVAKSVELANRGQEIYATTSPDPLRTMLIEGCLESGREYKMGGPTYNHGQILAEALPDAADSLANIKHFVYDTKKYTMAQVVDALEKNYEGYEEMHKDFNNSHLKFGNDCEEVDKLCADIMKHFFTEMSKYRTFRDPVNGIYGGGLSTFNRAGRFAETNGASASGRRNKEIVADSISAVPGKDKKGPTAVLKSVLNYDQKLAKSGFVLQMKFDKTLFNSPKGQEGFYNLVKTYFAGGGQQMSINVLDQQELLDAQKNPEKYKTLVVRVGGYSDYFVNLSPSLQQNIIDRTSLEFN